MKEFIDKIRELSYSYHFYSKNMKGQGGSS